MGSKCLPEMNIVSFFMPLSMVLEKLMEAMIYSPQMSTHDAVTEFELRQFERYPSTLYRPYPCKRRQV